MAEKEKGDGSQEVPRRPGPVVHTSWGDIAAHWPKTTFCIISNEFCERFSYYGMRTVLTFYILNVLKFDSGSTTIFFNSFTILCYLTPLLGSIIADGFIGKFWTIFFVSILYAIGQIILAFSSIQDQTSKIHPVLDLVGLIVIGFGTGGIKPCVAPFGADQFEKGQERMISVYFSMFYFSINAGSMISTFISPIFRSKPCLGQDSCYPLCFGIPAILMIVATGLFMAGSFWYKKPPPTESVFSEVAKIIGVGVKNAISNRDIKREYLLQHFLDTHFCSEDERCLELQRLGQKEACHKAAFVNDVRALLRLVVMFLPVPMFWALYDQQGSIWLLQGIQMDCNVYGILLLPDQMQTLNAVLILLFIPLFQAVVYPIASKCITLTPLRKIVAGGWLAALSFLVTGFVQLQVNTTLPSLPMENEAYVSFMNIYTPTTLTPNCTITVASLVMPEENYTLSANQSLPRNVSFEFSPLTKQRKKDGHSNVFSIAVGPDGAFMREVSTDKPTEGTGEFSLGLTLALENEYTGNMAVCRMDADDFDTKHPCNPKNPSDFYFWERDYNGGTDDVDTIVPVLRDDDSHDDSQMNVTAYVFKSVRPGKWGIYFLLNTVRDIDHPPTKDKTETLVNATGIDFTIYSQGGVYDFVITGKGLGSLNNKLSVYKVVQDNRVNILWQVPQIVILTAAEILFSITGYEFAYSQCPPSLTSVVQALWLLTTAIGDTIIVGITAADLFTNMATQFFVYAAAMFIVICIFALMAIFYYDYHYYTRAEEDEYSISSDDTVSEDDEKSVFCDE